MLLPSDDSDGNNGYFEIPLEEGVVAKVIASDGMGWDHVSVHIEEDGEDQTPTWDEMCRIKDMFWGKEACVFQYHPPKSKYVNNHPNVLHLWRKQMHKFEMPPPEMVGLKHKKSHNKKGWG